MTDFFDDLERQLVAATPRRPARIRRARRQRAAAVAGAIVVLLAGGAGIAAAVGGSGGEDAGAPLATSTAETTTAATPKPPAPTATTPADRRDSPVAILNGTTIPGLGRGVANRLQNEDIKIGNVTNAATQGHAVTCVYVQAQRDIRLATRIASTLRLGDAQGKFTLRRLPKSIRRIAGGSARVVVVVGSDQNHATGP